MAIRSNQVNLDAMIKREDFATSDKGLAGFENVSTISLRDFTSGGLIGPSLRKPDFQRETNHWIPEQVVSLLECFVNGDLIPSVILWQSPTYLFVIDGGHRLSALRAWVEDDYGDGPISQSYFGNEISEEQKKIAKKTRDLVAARVGSWKHHQTRIADDNLDANERRKLNAIVSRGLPIQWVKGDADKAESSFFKINTKGTPLDDIEELLLTNRRKSIPIAARAIIRSGKGHRYWSAFEQATASNIEASASKLHSILFDPEIRQQPIKTLDLPLGGPKGVRTALEVLIELGMIAIRNQQGNPAKLTDLPDDVDGQETLKALSQTLRLMERITGNEKGSLGLHPAVYFYGANGRHSIPMFLGTVSLIKKKLLNNDPNFFQQFTSIRSKLEQLLITHKDLMATILPRYPSARRSERYSSLLDSIIERLVAGSEIDESELVKLSGLEGKIFVGTAGEHSASFSDETKSRAFLSVALQGCTKCPICGGYIDAVKSVSYDHNTAVRDGGIGSVENCQLTHPFCNQSVKC